MLCRIDYLDFAARWFGQVSFDLATSGLSMLGAGELGPCPSQDDFGACEGFSRAVSERYRVSAAEVVPTLGASGALFSIVAACVPKADRVLVEAPAYEPLRRVPELLGLGVDRFERRIEHGFALDPDAIAAALSPRTRMVLVTNPHNPSGVHVADGALRELAGVLAERGVLLLVDEVYRELAAPGTTTRELGPNVLTCASLTKCWGLPWARAGWAIVPSELSASIRHVERYVAGLAPPSAWSWGTRALGSAEELVRRAASLQAGKREIVDRFMLQHRETLEWSAPHPASLFGWVHDRRGVCSLSRIEQGVSEQGVVVSPGEFFDSPGWFRLSWAAERGVVEEGLRRLAAVLSL